jgi:hypothetical protein
MTIQPVGLQTNERSLASCDGAGACECTKFSLKKGTSLCQPTRPTSHE